MEDGRGGESEVYADVAKTLRTQCLRVVVVVCEIGRCRQKVLGICQTDLLPLVPPLLYREHDC